MDRLTALLADPSLWDSFTPEEMREVRIAAASAAEQLVGQDDEQSLAQAEQLVGIGEEAERRLNEIEAVANARKVSTDALRERLASLSVVIPRESETRDPSPGEVGRARGRETTPPPEEKKQLALVASAGLADFDAGHPFEDLSELASAFISKSSALPPWSGGDQPERYRIARFNLERPITLGDDSSENESLLEQVSRMTLRPKNDEERALVAALCPPAEPIYDYFDLRSTFGILDSGALPVVSAPRGAKAIPVSPSRADIYADATWFAAIAQTAATGKACFTVPCGVYNEVVVTPRSTCLVFDNFTAQFNPERVRSALAETMEVHARKLQGSLTGGYIQQIGTASVAKADAGLGGGALTQMIRTLRTAGAMYRNRFRLAATQRLELIFPAWVPEVIINDVIARGATLDFDRSYDFVLDLIRGANFEPHPVWDYQNLANSATLGVLDDVEMIMYAPGTWVALDGGTLDIGVQRDAASNQANTFQVFMEQWTAVAKIGWESWRITNMDLCASGGVGVAAAIACGYVS